MKKYIKKYFLFGLLAALMMVLEVSMDLIQPRMMSTIVDEGVLGLSNGGVSDLGLILTTGVKMIGVLILGGFGGVMCGVFENLCSQNFAGDVRKEAFGKIMNLSLQQIEHFSTGSLITRVTNDVNQIQLLVRSCVRGVVRNLMFLFGGIACMLMLDLSFGIVLACTVPVILVAMYFFITRSSPKFTILQDKLDHVNTVMQENVSGARVVKAYVKENYETGRFHKANDELVGTQLQILIFLSYMTPLMNIVMNLAVIFVIRAGGIRVQAGAITPGIVMAAITYITQILNAALRMSMTFQSVSRGVASARRVNEILQCEPEIADGSRADEEIRPQTIQGSRIEFRHVSFAYSDTGEKILNDINLDIAPGETIGIMGMTGSGKSSLVQLIPRFYDVTEGEILIDGVNVQDYSVRELREKVGIALQKSEIFADSILNNITMGHPGASEEEAEEAARTAQALEFIERMPDGMQSQVTQSGTSLSGGQKQRLAIARAVIKKAPILILDDATSALDLKTEANLFDGLRREQAGQTRIIVAQRIASVKDADRILILDHRTIASLGSHEELLASSDIYREIYESQMGGVSDGGE